MIKAEAIQEPFAMSLPSKNTMLDPYTSESDSDKNLGKMMININNDHYSKSYNSVGSEGSKFTSVNSSYGNDNRFASISSEPITPLEESNSNNSDSSYSKLYSFFGSALQKTYEVAGVVKDRVSTIDFGDKLRYTGEVLKYTGSKVYEKGSDIVVRHKIRL